MPNNQDEKMDDWEMDGVVYGNFIVEVDDPGPPPETTSAHQNIVEWLKGICNGDQPTLRIAEYQFGLFEGEGYTICLYGTNTYQVSANHTANRIEFTPKEMYFALPGKQYPLLDRTQLLEHISAELTAFINSDTFQQSFLMSAESIKADWLGEIWPNK